MKKYLFNYNKNDRAIKKALTMLFWYKRGVPNYYDYDIWYIMYYGIPKFLYYLDWLNSTRPLVNLFL